MDFLRAFPKIPMYLYHDIFTRINYTIYMHVTTRIKCITIICFCFYAGAQHFHLSEKLNTRYSAIAFQRACPYRDNFDDV